MRYVVEHLVIAGMTLVMLVLGISAAGKLYNLPVFAESLSTWNAFPPQIRTLVLYTLPAIEGIACAIWFSRKKMRVLGAGLAFVVVTAAVGGLAFQYAHAVPPSCGCFGALQQHFQLMDNSLGSFGKGIVLMLVTLTFLVFERYQSKGVEVQQ